MSILKTIHLFKSFVSHHKKSISLLVFTSVTITSLSACKDDNENVVELLPETTQNLITHSPAQTSTYSPRRGQHRHSGYRQPGYVNQDGYISGNIYNVENLAYYGDWDANRVYIIDVDNMSLVTTVENTGDGPYGIDQQGVNKAYALTRKTESLTIVDNYTLENDGLIELQHKPRSTNFNANTLLSLVSGGDKAMTSIIRTDKNKVVQVVGENELTVPYDFGGSLSTGHPLWISDHHFFMLDRAARKIQLWRKDGALLSTLTTPTSIHHIFQPPKDTIVSGDENIFYAVVEGNQNEGISPGVIRFEINGDSLEQTSLVNLYDYAPEELELATMGSHHADFHPDGLYIYIGSAEGHTFVINKDTMTIEAMIETGNGSGHTTFLAMRDQAIITNHNATYMTVIDTINHQAIRNIEVASSASPDYKSQSHTSGVSLDMKYFYSAASYDGTFFRIDLDTWQVDTLFVGGNILMGSFIWNGEAENM